MNKSKKVIAVVVTVVMALLLTAMVLLLCILPNKDNNTAGSDDGTTQTPGDGTGNNGGSSDNNEGNSGSGNSGSTGNPSDSQNPAEEFTYITPSAITLTSDKTELTAGDTFTISVEIFTDRTDLYWQAIDVVIGPMTDETTVSTEISNKFELVDYTINDKFSSRSVWDNNTNDKFNSTVDINGFRVSLAFIGTTPVSSTEKLVVTATIKVKDNSTPVDSFLFGITKSNYNMISFISKDYSTDVYDYTNGTTETNNSPVVSANCGITTQKITMSIKAKSN